MAAANNNSFFLHDGNVAKEALSQLLIVSSNCDKENLVMSAPLFSCVYANDPLSNCHNAPWPNIEHWGVCDRLCDYKQFCVFQMIQIVITISKGVTFPSVVWLNETESKCAFENSPFPFKCKFNLLSTNINKFHFTALGLCKSTCIIKQLVKVQVTQSGNVWAKSFSGYSLHFIHCNQQVLENWTCSFWHCVGLQQSHSWCVQRYIADLDQEIH